MKLISMTEFVLQHKENSEFQMNNTVLETGKLLQKVFKYAEFLRKPLTLGMFVPVDEEGNVLDNESRYPALQEALNLKLDEEYARAKEKVLFEGFKIAWDGEAIISICLDDLNLAFDKTTLKSGMNYTIEHLCQYRLQFTPSALKQIGL